MNTEAVAPASMTIHAPGAAVWQALLTPTVRHVFPWVLPNVTASPIVPAELGSVSQIRLAA